MFPAFYLGFQPVAKKKGKELILKALQKNMNLRGERSMVRDVEGKPKSCKQILCLFFFIFLLPFFFAMSRFGPPMSHPLLKGAHSWPTAPAPFGGSMHTHRSIPDMTPHAR